MEKRSYDSPLMVRLFKSYEDRFMDALRPYVKDIKGTSSSYVTRRSCYAKLLLVGFLLGVLSPLGWLIVETSMGLRGQEAYYRGVLYVYLTLASLAVCLVVSMIMAVRIEREVEARREVAERDMIIQRLDSFAEEIKREFRENMIKLSNSAVEISKASDENQVLHTLMRTVRSGLDFDRILILVREGEHLVMSNCHGHGEKALCDLNVELPYSEAAGAFFLVCKECESCIFSEDDYIPAEFRIKPPYSNVHRFRTKAFIMVPIRRPGNKDAYGVLAADRKYTKRGVSENDLLLVEMLAEMAGYAIDRIEMNRDLENKASLDELTQVYNRRRWLESAEHALKTAKRYGGDLSMIILDIDNFKSINDTWGHQSGDKVLRETAAIIREYSREADVVGRYGGEEFVILCPRSDLSSTVEVAERLRKIIETTPFGIPRKVTATFGVAQATWEEIESLDVDSLLSRADRALYAGKSRSGKNCVVTWGEVEKKLSPLYIERTSVPAKKRLEVARNAV